MKSIFRRKIITFVVIFGILTTIFAAMSIVALAAEECICTDRCTSLDIAESECAVCSASGDPADCMGTPELTENGSVWRLSDSEAELGFSGYVNRSVTWKYYYILTDDSAAEPSADEIMESGISGVYDDPYTLTLTDLTAGERYIHILLRQKEQDRTTNILRLTIPEFVELTITPSAEGGSFDAESNTLTVSGGSEVTFTLNLPGYVRCETDETIEATPAGGEYENALVWTAPLPDTPGTYVFYYGLYLLEARCSVTVSEHTHNYEYECSAKCSGCDYERLATHVYDGEDYGDGEQHLLRCRYCGVQYRTDNLTSVFPHEYDDDCDSVCDICGYERTDAHNYEWIKDAEGHEEKCSVCGDVRVERAAHTSGASATDDTPETCTVCGYEMAPKLESTLTIIYNNTAIGGILAYHPGRAMYTFPTGTVVDLSEYWPDTREYTVDGRQYYFSNFYPNETGGKRCTSIVLNGDITLYAGWSVDGNRWIVTFDATGGSIVPKKIMEYYFSGINFYEPTRPGYEFLGWSLENDGTPDSFENYSLTSDCTLYATWKRVHNISSNWSYDEEVHYRTCDCGERHDESEHSYYITSPICYKCGYVQGMAIGSTDKTSVEFVPVTGTTLPEGSYLDVKAYEVVEKDVEAIFKAAVTEGVSGVTEIIPETKGKIRDDGWVFSEQYTLRMGDKVTIGGVTYIVISYEGGKACLISGGEEYYLDKDTGLYKTGYRYDSYSTDTELISIDGVQYVIVCRITSGDFETVYFTTTEGKAAGHYLVDKGEMSHARFYSDCTPEALTPKVSVGGVVAVADGQFLVNTASGVKIANTIWANDVSLHDANGLPVTGINGTLTVSGIQYVATKSTVAAHIGAEGVDVGRFDDSVFDIRDVDDFSPFVLLEVADFGGTVIELRGIAMVEDAEPDGHSTGAVIAIILACLAVAFGGMLAFYWFVLRKGAVKGKDD